MEVALNVIVGNTRNIRSSRGVNNYSVFAKVEFKSETLGESSRHELQEGVSQIDMNFSVTYPCKLGNHASVEAIMTAPLIVSILEVLPKDKKAKEEKSQLLGVGSLDLLPFFKGEQTIEECLVLYPLNYQTNEVELSSLIEMNIKASMEKPLLSDNERDHGNILFVRVKGLYSLPDGIASGGAHTFTVATPSPNNLNNPMEILAAQGGELKTAGNADIALANKKWKWPSVSSASLGMASLITDSVLAPNAVEDEKGHLRSVDDVEFRRTAECMKPNVAWNMELRSLLTSASTTAFLRLLSTCSIWPMEIIRVLSIAGKGKNKDETLLSYNGICYVDLSTLLYPGATKLFGAFPVGPLIESELGKKCKVIDRSMMDNIHKATAPAPPKGSTGGKRPGTAARQSVVSLTSQTSIAATDENTEGHSYLESKTYMLLEIELAKPLVPKRTAITIADRILEYIPPRPALPKRIGGVQKAINEYHTATVDIASLLLADYRTLFGEEVSTDTLVNTPEASEERRKKLIYHLNKSGHYHAYKEHLKRSVLELVRQKFINEASTKCEEELQAFLSKLYTYLVDEMHKGLGQVFSLEDSAPDPPNMVDCDMLRQYALESEQMMDMKAAEYYHKELLSREDHISLHWYEYGVYHLINSDYDKAEQCFKESISLDQKFFPALLLYGICCSINNKHSEADEVLEFATTIDDSNVIAWTIRGLCYELSNNTLLRDMCLEQAYKLTPGGKKKTYIVMKKASSKKVARGGGGGAGGGVGGDLDEPEQQLHASSEKTLPSIDQDQPETENPETIKDSSSPLPDSLNNTQEQLQVQTSTNEDERVNNTNELKKESEVLSSSCDKDRANEFSPFVQTASYLLDVSVAKFAEMCLAHEYVFQSSKSQTQRRKSNGKEAETKKSIPTNVLNDAYYMEETEAASSPSEFISLQYDITMGRLLMLNRDYSLAQSYFRRAVEMDILNSNAVALLGHCLYLLNELDEAKDFYQRAVEYVNPPAHLNTVLLRLADIYMKHKQYAAAKDTYLRACRYSPSSVTWKGVGIACFMLQEYQNSEDALSEANILNNLDPEIWAYLSLLCLKTNRIPEASQAASFALKTGLQNPELLELLPRADP